MSNNNIDANKPKISIIGGGPNGLAMLADLKTNYSELFDTHLYEQGDIAHNISQLPDTRWHSSMNELKLDNFLYSNNSIFLDDIQPEASELANFYRLSAMEYSKYISTSYKLLNIEKIDRSNHSSYNLVFDNNKGFENISTDCLIMATGITESPRKINVANYGNLNSYLDISIKGKKILLIGSGSSSIDAIINLLPYNIIYWVRRSNLRKVFPTLSLDYNKILSDFDSNLTIFDNSEVIKYDLDSKSFVITNNILLKVDHVISLCGYVGKSVLSEKLKLAHSNDFILYDIKTLMTSIDNIYLFGSNLTQHSSSKLSRQFIHNGRKTERNKIIKSIISSYYPELIHFLRNNYLTLDNSKSSFREIIKSKLRRLFRKAGTYILGKLS